MKPSDSRDPTRSEAPAAGGEAAADRLRAHQLVCDFCGEPAPSVRRVALDGEYERLRTRHKPRYACPRCSERKEQERLGLARR